MKTTAVWIAIFSTTLSGCISSRITPNGNSLCDPTITSKGTNTYIGTDSCGGKYAEIGANITCQQQGGRAYIIERVGKGIIFSCSNQGDVGSYDQNRIDSQAQARRDLERAAALREQEAEENWKRIGRQGELMSRPGYQWGDTEDTYNQRQIQQTTTPQIPSFQWIVDVNGNPMGRIDRSGQLFDPNGNRRGRVDGGGNIYDTNGNRRGRIDGNGNIYDTNGNRSGSVR